MSGWAADLALGAAVLLGASVQRLAGMGFALVAAPALVLLLGPAAGVGVSNCCSAAISAVGLAATWRRVRPAAMAPLIAAAACTVPVGAWVTTALPEPVLMAGMGALVTAAVLVVIAGTRVAALRGVGGAVAAGAASGFMNAAAGVGGPALSLYAVNAEWPVRQFVPNALCYSVVVNVFSLTAKGLPHLTATAWWVAAAGITGGAGVGWALAERVPERGARLLMLTLALLGGVTTLGKGLWSL